MEPTDPAMIRARELFKNSGLTLDVVGGRMGYEKEVARKSAWQFLNKTDDPRLSMLRKFAEAIRVPVLELFVLKKTGRLKQSPRRSDMRPAPSVVETFNALGSDGKKYKLHSLKDRHIVPGGMWGEDEWAEDSLGRLITDDGEEVWCLDEANGGIFMIPSTRVTLRRL